MSTTELTQKAPAMHVIKRYPNRKLYDTEAKAYVTLDGIAELIRVGDDVQVVDHESGEDLTTVTLSQIILEQEKRQVGALPKVVLTSLIQTGGDTLDMFKRSFYSSLGAVRLIEEGIEKRLDTMVRRGQMPEAEAQSLREKLLRYTHDLYPDEDTLSSPMDAAFDRLNIPTRADVKRLSTQLEELALKLDALLEAEATKSTEQHTSDRPSDPPTSE
ncbi:MAG: polyhydroxyalkanoate synthesis regulator DNA-binding domain-containing protein [Anaerolineae bacterium]